MKIVFGTLIGFALIVACDEVEQMIADELPDVGIEVPDVDIDLPGGDGDKDNGVGSGGSSGPSGNSSGVSSIGAARALPSDTPSLSQAQSAGTVRISSGSTVFVAGYRQVSGNNQNPLIARYDNGNLTWSRVNYETGTPDARAYGLLFDPSSNKLYAIFSVDGGQSGSSGFERFTGKGWLRGYGTGGGPKVAVVAQINPSTGAPIGGTFVTAQLSNGKTNSVQVTGISLSGGNLILKANSWYSPRKTNGSPFSCTGSSPFSYSLTLSGDLSRALSASAPGCQ